jgi:hypothetical protein
MIVWLNLEFKRVEIKDYVVVRIGRTRYTTQQYENGAAKLSVTFQSVKNKSLEGNFLCFYSLGEYMDHMEKGYEMYVTFTNKRFEIQTMDNLTVELRKKK